jgi:Family of unknown function (DUF6498)
VIRWLSAASSSASIVALLVANLLPLIGVALWGWSLGSILVLYWIENGIVGLLNIGKILLARGTVEPEPSVSPIRIENLPGIASAGCLIPFYIAHYGIFWVVHGVFVMVIASGAFFGVAGADAAGVPRVDVIVLGTIALAASHGISFATNYLGRGEFRTATPQGQMMSVYGRVLVLHLTILIGAFLAIRLGNPIGVLLVLVAGKTILDLVLHLREHARAARRMSPTPEVSGP